MEILEIQHVWATSLAVRQSWLSGNSCNWSDIDQRKRKQVPELSAPRYPAAWDSELEAESWTDCRCALVAGCQVKACVF